MRTQKVPDIWIVSNFAPPVHGVSVFNSLLASQLDTLGVVHRDFRVGTRGPLSRIGRPHFTKYGRDAMALSRLVLSGLMVLMFRRPKPVLYFTPSQEGSVVFRDLAITVIGSAFSIPRVAHIHGCGWLPRWQRGDFIARIMDRALRPSAGVICLGSRFAMRMTLETGMRCHAVNNGTPIRGEANAKTLPGLNQRIELLYLSNLVRAKGLWTAAEALRLLARSGSFRLRCAGSWMSPDEESDFRAEFAPEIAHGVLELVGQVDSDVKYELLERAHFLLLPTRYPLEGQPLSILEAMSCATVPVTTDHGGIPDLFEFKGGIGLANAAHAHPVGLAATIENLIGSPETYGTLSERCLAHSREHLTIERCTLEIIRLLAEASGTPLGTSGAGRTSTESAPDKTAGVPHR